MSEDAANCGQTCGPLRDPADEIPLAHFKRCVSEMVSVIEIGGRDYKLKLFAPTALFSFYLIWPLNVLNAFPCTWFVLGEEKGWMVYSSSIEAMCCISY